MTNRRPTFDHFRSLVEADGLQAVDCGNGHWQVRGGVKPVNVYPFKRGGPRLYVSGAVKGVDQSPRFFIEAAIVAAKDGKMGRLVDVVRVGRKSSSWSRRMRAKLFRKRQQCHWCPTIFANPEEATLDHIVPLIQGGSNRRDNLTLACEPCNKRRGGLAVRPEQVAE